MINTLYITDVRGKLRIWEIESFAEGFALRQGLLTGKIQEKWIDVIPKSNRDMEEQVTLEMNSRISKQLDKGYKLTIAEAKEKKSNASGLIIPMKAQPIEKVKNPDMANALIQRKYNGHRCTINSTKGKVTAHSKSGKLITSVNHILNTIDMPDGTIDGELYVHGMSLQKIGSLVRKEQDLSQTLYFVAYDKVMPGNYTDRLAGLEALALSKENIITAGTYKLGDKDPLSCMQTFVEEGYEGAIIRLDNFGYEDGKRSRGLLKVKPRYDAEFTVIDIIESKDGWAILVCSIPWESPAKTFKVTAHGTHAEKIEIYKHRHLHIGRSVRVEYYDVTQDAVPFHPVSLMWRNKGEE